MSCSGRHVCVSCFRVRICLCWWHCVVITFGVWAGLTVTEVVLHSVRAIARMCLGMRSAGGKARCSASQ